MDWPADLPDDIYCRTCMKKSSLSAFLPVLKILSFDIIARNGCHLFVCRFALALSM